MDINEILKKNLDKVAAEGVTIQDATIEEPLNFEKKPEAPPVTPPKFEVDTTPLETSKEEGVSEEGLMSKMGRAEDLMTEIISYVKAGFGSTDLERPIQELDSLLSDIKTTMSFRKID
jgi:hypothetical protein